MSWEDANEDLVVAVECPDCVQETVLVRPRGQAGIVLCDACSTAFWVEKTGEDSFDLLRLHRED